MLVRLAIQHPSCTILHNSREPYSNQVWPKQWLADQAASLYHLVDIIWDKLGSRNSSRDSSRESDKAGQDRAVGLKRVYLQ
jgi:hypothetical protein